MNTKGEILLFLQGKKFWWIQRIQEEKLNIYAIGKKITETYQETETKKKEDSKKSKTHRSKKHLFTWIDRRKKSLRHKDCEVYYNT